MFPDGSGSGITNAKPEVWERWPEFKSKAKALVDEAERLQQQAVAMDASAILNQYRAIDRVCADCHHLFRRPKK
jgi:cytochrome c556